MRKNGYENQRTARTDKGTFTIPMLVLTIALVIGIVILALFLRVNFCSEEPESGARPQGSGSIEPFGNGVPEQAIDEALENYVRAYGATDYTVESLRHGMDRAAKTDTVTFVLNEQRSDGVYRSQHIMSFLYDPETGTWTVAKHDHTTPQRIESESQEPDAPQTQPVTPPPSAETSPTTPPPASPEELPDTFTFGGAVIKRGETGITGSKRGINGPDAEHPTHITAEEVALLVKLCPDLQLLDLDCCYLDDYAPLGKLTKLKKLVLTRCGTKTKGNRIRSIEWISGLKNLETLYLTHNDISDLSPIAGLKKLEDLRVGRNQLTGQSLAGLTDLPKLLYLSINANDGIKTLSKLPVLENLRFIDASYCLGLTSLDGMKQQPQMKMLKCNGSALKSLDGVASQPALVEIDVSECGLDASEYRKLEKCPKLQYVVIAKKDKTANGAMDTVESNEPRISRLYEWKYIAD